MLFESLYNLIYERNQANVLTYDTLVKYYYYHIGSNEKNVKAIYKYLKDNNIPKMHCMIVEDIGQMPEDKPYYFFLITKVMNSDRRAKEMKEIKKLVDADSLLRITQYGEYPAEDLESGTQYDYEPMGKYNVDDETKETWKEIIPEL
jgi:hypothetical protein